MITPFRFVAKFHGDSGKRRYKLPTHSFPADFSPNFQISKLLTFTTLPEIFIDVNRVLRENPQIVIERRQNNFIDFQRQISIFAVH